LKFNHVKVYQIVEQPLPSRAHRTPEFTAEDSINYNGVQYDFDNISLGFGMPVPEHRNSK